MADSAGPDRAASMEERKREYERAEREIMKVIETGKVSGEDGKRRLGELRRRMFGGKETEKAPSMEQRKKTGAPPLGIHLLMGGNAPEKLQNMVKNLGDDRIAVVQTVAQKG